jgi:predicted acyltransferase
MPTTVEFPFVDEDVQSEPLSTEPAKPVRLKSLDIFRGITIAGMLLVNNLTDEEHSYKVLTHSPWHGWTPTDLIFPFFMFIVGVAIPFSLAKRKADPTVSRLGLLAHIWARAVALIVLGFLIHIIFSATPPLPPGQAMLQIVRWITMIYGYGGIVLLLWPIRSAKISNWIPPILAAFFVILIFSMHFIVRHATDSGLSQAIIGGGIFEPHMFRIPGVLQRIGICYGIAATIGLFAGWRTILACSLGMLILYSALMLKAPFHDGHVTGAIEHDDNLEHSIDQYVFDRFTIDEHGKKVYSRKLTYNEYADPEGLLSTIPAAVSPMLGILLGLFLKRTDRTNIEKCAAMLTMGVFVSILGCCLSAWLMPINKKIWSPSFVVFTAGLAMLGLGAIFWIIDVKGWRRWAIPFGIFGMNSIAAYAGSDVLIRISRMIHVQGQQLNVFLEARCVGWIQHFSAWLQIHSTHFPVLDTPANLTMVWGIIVILATMLLLTPLYCFKIYLKV